jgi:hypothetical protein
MGTNYYHISKPCEKCGRHEKEKHIGKSSGGWQFHFRGYRDECIVSFKDWLEQLKDPNKEIIDEYGRKIPLEDFLGTVTSKKHENLNHYNVCCNHPMNEHERKYLADRPGIYPSDGIEKRTWKDDEGFAFTENEFS